MQLIVCLNAVVTRLLFMLHAVLAVWRVVQVEADRTYWLLALANVFLGIEMVLTLKFRKGRDLKWFSPAIFLYLISVVPSLWLLEMNYDAQDSSNRSLKSIMNESTRADAVMVNTTHFDSKLKDMDSASVPEVHGLDFAKIPGVQEAVALVTSLDAVGDTVWTLALHQTFLLLLIIGKWFLPTDSETTREQLSQLLLLFVGTAADILEFTTETLEQKNVRNNIVLVYLILSVWTWSLLQFPLDVAVKSFCHQNPSSKRRCSLLIRRYSADLWNIGISIFIQDGPFLVVRLLLMIYYDVINQMLVFFTAKNCLVVMLQLYRLIVLCVDFQASLVPRQFIEAKTCPTEGQALCICEPACDGLSEPTNEIDPNGTTVDFAAIPLQRDVPNELQYPVHI